MSLMMNNYPQHPPSSSQHHSSLAHVHHSHPQDAHQHSSQVFRPDSDRTYRLPRDQQLYSSSSTSYADPARYRQHMQPQERRSNSPYHHATMMNVPQVQQPPLQPPHPPMHDPNSRPPASGPYDFPSDVPYQPQNPGPSDFHHAPPMYRADVNPVPAPGPPIAPPQAHAGRPLNNSKRAEQNRKAQRAFRERRDQHVKQLESRSAMLDVALANADEANRRLEDSRILVEQLRAENQALRTALSAYVPQHGHPHSQLMIQAVPIPGLQLSQANTQPAPPAGAAPEAAQGQPAAQPQPQVPVLDPSLPSQTQTSTQDSASAPLTSGMDGLVLAYPAPVEGQGVQQPDADRRSGTPAAVSAGSPAPVAGPNDGAPEGDQADA
ncbi:hypothetical protein FRC07_000734 [Ceratobasidium sp. 392]|nr:hypothetical protein FRC07_000734 [Ceratobasidium sp. 392]